jgi:hypothetical protein
MSDVFISYSQRDRSVAEKLAGQLEELGLRIWWDLKLYSGENFRKAILAALNAAKAVIVIWSDTAAQSDWVLDEAEEAKRQKKLIATCLPQFDLTKLPMGFRQRHTSKIDDLTTILRALSRFGVQSANEPAVREKNPDRRERTPEPMREALRVSTELVDPVPVPPTPHKKPSPPPPGERSPSPIAAANEPKARHNVIRTLGVDPSTGKQVTVGRGRYGPYVQLGEGERFVAVPGDADVEALDLCQAIELLAATRRKS